MFSMIFFIIHKLKVCTASEFPFRILCKFCAFITHIFEPDRIFQFAKGLSPQAGIFQTKWSLLTFPFPLPLQINTYYIFMCISKKKMLTMK